MQASVQMGEQKYNPVEGKMTSSPSEVDISNLKLLILV